MRRSAFTMVELVFVIVILGIMAAIAVPRLGASREDANIAKYKGDISAIRSSIVTTRSQQLMAGNNALPVLEGANAALLFDGVLDYPIQPAANGRSGWSLAANGDYVLTINGLGTTTFSYNNNGIFDCLDAAGNVVGGDLGLCNTLRQ